MYRINCIVQHERLIGHAPLEATRVLVVLTFQIECPDGRVRISSKMHERIATLQCFTSALGIHFLMTSTFNGMRLVTLFNEGKDIYYERAKR